MQSILFITPDSESRKQYAVSFCNTHGIAAVDQLWITIESQTKTKQSIGIENIQDIKPTLHLRPMKSSTKIIIFPEADLLTIEAQNALLKMLEEPPEFVTFLLCSENEESLLPTIISRCTIVTDINKQKGLSAEDLSAFRDTYQTLSGLSLSEALELAESVAKNKDSAVIWLEKIIMAGRNVLLDEALKNNTGSGNTRILRQLQSTYQDIKKTNANTRLMLESCLLSLR